MSLPATNHIRAMSELMKIPSQGWLLYPIVRSLLELAVDENSVPGGGSLAKQRDPGLVRDTAMNLLRLWFVSLKPRGGSFAGATKVNGAVTVPDPAGEADLPAVITTLIPGIGEHGASVTDAAARLLRDVVRDAVTNPYYGFRACANLFHSVETDNLENAYTLLNDCMSQLDPLEALIHGPDHLYSLEKHGATNHAAVFRVEQLQRYEADLLASFRSSTKVTKMPDALLTERKFYIGHLQHLASRNHLTASARHDPGASTASAQYVVRELFAEVCADPKLTGEQIKQRIADGLTNVRGDIGSVQTRRVYRNGEPRPSPIPYDRNGNSLPHLNNRAAVMSGRRHPSLSATAERTARPARPARRAAAAEVTGATAQVTNGNRASPGPRAPTRGPAGGPPNALTRKRNAGPGRDKSRDACGSCGELGHWRAECPHRVA